MLAWVPVIVSMGKFDVPVWWGVEHGKHTTGDSVRATKPNRYRLAAKRLGVRMEGIVQTQGQNIPRASMDTLFPAFFYGLVHSGECPVMTRGSTEPP